MDRHSGQQDGRGERRGQMSLLGTASTMGLHMVSGPVVGGGLGWLADHWLGSWPVGAAIGFVLGLAAGFRNVWADARYLERSNAANDAARKKEEEEASKTSGKGRRQTKKAVTCAIVPDVHKAGVDEGSAASAAGSAPSLSVSGEDVGGEDAGNFTASVLAGMASPAESGLEELDETEEAIRRALRGDGRQTPSGGGEKGGRRSE